MKYFFLTIYNVTVIVTIISSRVSVITIIKFQENNPPVNVINMNNSFQEEFHHSSGLAGA